MLSGVASVATAAPIAARGHDDSPGKGRRHAAGRDDLGVSRRGRSGAPVASAKHMRDRSRMTELAFQDEAPTGSTVTAYDEGHLVTYLRILDATAEQADWREVVQLVFGLDPEREPERARRVYDSHLARARWMTECGYRDLVAKGRSRVPEVKPDK
jgi:hypothetical protein